MIHRNKVAGMVAGALLCAFAIPASADPGGKGEDKLSTRLSGYEETPLTLITPGNGEFTAKINHDDTAIEFKLTYQDLVGVTQAHIHIGRPALSGGVALFLCTNMTPPAGVPLPKPCPATGGTVTGTLTAADVIASTNGQGVVSGAQGFADILEAIRSQSAYANVHTTAYPPGEIRGQIGTRGHPHGH